MRTLLLALGVILTLSIPSRACEVEVVLSDEGFNYVGGKLVVSEDVPTAAGIEICGKLWDFYQGAFWNSQTQDFVLVMGVPAGFRVFAQQEVTILTEATCDAGLVLLTVDVDHCDPVHLLDGLVADVFDLNLAHGIENSLDAKLDTAIDALADTVEGNDHVAVEALYAFVHAVSAQAGKKITEEEADRLIGDALAIIDVLDG